MSITACAQYLGETDLGSVGMPVELTLVQPVRPDERLEGQFERRCDLIDGSGPLAVEGDGQALTYAQLDQRANQLARYLRLRGAGAGDRIAVLLDRPTERSLAMLAVLKIGASYLPLDPASTGQILASTQPRLVLTDSALAAHLTGGSVEHALLDQAAPLIAEMSKHRLTPAELGGRPGPVAVITYAADGSTVVIEHTDLCDQVTAATDALGIEEGDRVYRTATASHVLDPAFSAWSAGATMVSESAGALQGSDLHRYLTGQRVTTLVTGSSELAQLSPDLPALRLLVVISDRPAPAELIDGWQRPGRRIVLGHHTGDELGPVSWTELPGRDGIASVLAPVDDELASTQAEVARVRAQMAAMREQLAQLQRSNAPAPVPAPARWGAQAPAPFAPAPFAPASFAPASFAPASFAPAPFAPAPFAPAMPAPTQVAMPAAVPAPVAPAPAAVASSPVQDGYATLLAGILGLPEVSVDANLFADLGADSMTMARFCAGARKRPDLPNVTMRDVYRYKTIRELASAGR